MFRDSVITRVAPINITYVKVPPKIEKFNEIELPINTNLSLFKFFKLNFKDKLRYIGYILSKQYIIKRVIPLDLPSNDIVLNRIDINKYTVFELISDNITNFYENNGFFPSHVLIGRDFYEKLNISSPDWMTSINLNSNGNFIAKGMKQFFNLEVIFNPYQEGIAVFHLNTQSL